MHVCVYMCVRGYRFKLDGDTRDWLEIDSSTGQIKTKAKLDRETLETLEVKVIAFEKGETVELVTVRFKTDKEHTFQNPPVFSIQTTPKCLPRASST